MNMNTNHNIESTEAATAIGMFLFGLLGCFFLCLNPTDSSTEWQFYFGLLASKAAMLASWAVAAKLYRKLYC